MIKYICNFCKKEIDKKVCHGMQIKKPNGDTAIFHFHEECLDEMEVLIRAGKEDSENPTKDKGEDDLGRTSADNSFSLNYFKNSKYITTKELPPQPKGKTNKTLLRRTLLGLYNNVPVSEIATLLGITYTNVVNYCTKYSSETIAKRHLSSKRDDEEVKKILDIYYKTGNISLASTESGCTQEDVIRTVDYYTGIIIIPH